MTKLLTLMLVLVVSAVSVGCGNSEDRRKYQDAEKPQSGEKDAAERKTEK